MQQPLQLLRQNVNVPTRRHRKRPLPRRKKTTPKIPEAEKTPAVMPAVMLLKTPALKKAVAKATVIGTK
jgi:hypothetical protein